MRLHYRPPRAWHRKGHDDDGSVSDSSFVQHDRSGLLVASQDASAMAVALARLVDDPALRERMGAHARQWALQNGSIDAMGAAYRALYERSMRSGVSSGGPDSFGSGRG